MTIRSFRELTVWQKSFRLATDVYSLTDQFPAAERFGLSSQIQRAAVSIPSNIAEGQQRNNMKEYRQFLGIAKGSAAELETQLLLAEAIYGAKVTALLETLYEIQKMLFSLCKKLEPEA
jgi:four helix bundle protein